MRRRALLHNRCSARKRRDVDFSLFQGTVILIRTSERNPRSMSPECGRWNRVFRVLQ